MKYKLSSSTPLVSICTPTFNRRPFIPMMIQCFLHQTYPHNCIEWIIVDDGTDKIEDLVSMIPQVKYISLETKTTLGKKRNIGNQLAKGDIIVYMDDDDYYPPDRIKHAVYTLKKNPKALCVGSSVMYIYYRDIQKMYRVGPYGDNHATAATFAFRKELLNITAFDETACVAEESVFLKGYTIPFAQLDPLKSILVFAHSQNSFDKREVLKGLELPLEDSRRRIWETNILPHDIIKEPEILHFFITELDLQLAKYEIGSPIYKTDVRENLLSIQKQREEKILEFEKQNITYETIIQKSLYIKQQTEENKKLIQENNNLKLLYQRLLNSNANIPSQRNQQASNIEEWNQQLREENNYYKEMNMALMKNKNKK